MRNKKVLIILIFIIACCYFLNFTYASNTATVYLSSNQEVVEKDGEIELTVNIQNRKTAAFDLLLYFDDSKWEYISNLENTNVIDDNCIAFVWHDPNGGNGAKEGEVAKFKFKAKEEGLSTFAIQGDFYSEKAQLLQTEFKEKQVQIGKEDSRLQKQAEERGNNLQSSNATLQALRLEREGLTPAFDSDVYTYYLTIPNDIQDVDVLAVSENPKATVEITGNTGFQEGLNQITIHVISEDQTQNNNYMIHVTKTANPELANTNLEMLAIENALLDPPFAVFETNYKAEVSQETENLNLLAVPENEQATVIVTGKENLKEGHNLVSVLVTAPNGFTKKKYEMDVYRRNLQEQKAYEEEQEEQKDKLEEAYQIEELSSDVGQMQEQATTSQSKKYDNVAVWIVLAILVGLVLIGFFWKKFIIQSR